MGEGPYYIAEMHIKKFDDIDQAIDYKASYIHFMNNNHSVSGHAMALKGKDHCMEEIVDAMKKNVDWP